MKSIWVFLTLVLLSRVNGFELLGNQTDVQLSKYLPPNTLYVPLTLIQNAAAKGAVCMDGSLPGYNLHRGFGSGSNNWIVNLEGGGWCNTANDCAGRKKNGRGSSTLMAHNIPFQGILSDKSNENPDFYNWNRVKIRYCDGGSFTGDNYLPKVGVYLRGQRIYQAAIDDLMSKGLRNANQVLLSGCSAGGLATIQHCDQFAALFPRGTKVKCLADAGLFLDAADVAGGRTLRAFFNGVVRIHASSRTLSKTCTSRMDPTSCFFPQNVIPTVKTPLFLLNTAYDVWQVKESLAKVDSRWNSCKDNYATCNSNQLQFLQGFRNQMLNVVSGFSRARRNGLFINSCFAHCQSETPDMWYSNNSPRIANKNIANAVGDWFFERSEAMDIDCAYPCDGTCHHLIFRKDQSLI